MAVVDHFLFVVKWCVLLIASPFVMGCLELDGPPCRPQVPFCDRVGGASLSRSHFLQVDNPPLPRHSGYKAHNEAWVWGEELFQAAVGRMETLKSGIQTVAT